MLRLFKQYYPIRNIFFILGEGLFIFSSFILASWIILGTESSNYDKALFLKIFLVTAVCQLCLYYNDLYEFKTTTSLNDLGFRLLQALGFAAILMAVIYFLFPDAIIGKGIFIVSVFFVILLIVSWRFCYALVLNHGLFNQKILLLGSSELLADIKQAIEDRKDCGYTVAEEFPETNRKIELKNDEKLTLRCGERYEKLAEIANYMGIKKIVAAFKEKRHTFPTKELLKCRVAGIEVIDGISFYEMLSGKLIVKQVHPSWFIFSEGFQKSPLRFLGKRIADVTLSFIMLVALSPLILITAILIKLDSKGPVFFSQERLGRNKKEYSVIKFRSMIFDAEDECGPVWAQDNDNRITRIGRVIRKFRIDEVPQLWNVLKGEMSFVGPRPEREFFTKELEKKIPYYGVRFTVKPGITGWAQVCYTYGASVEDAIEKLNYELFYIKNMSPWMDLLIILRTIKIVLFGKGAR
jgi:sugar transferase (PEP-CTERM system associated)